MSQPSVSLVSLFGLLADKSSGTLISLSLDWAGDFKSTISQ